MFSVHNFWASHALFCLLCLIYCIVGVTLCHSVSYMPLSVFGDSSVYISIQFESQWPVKRWLYLLKVIAYIHIFSIILVWYRSDLFNVSLQITGYASLHSQMPLHITLCKLVFTSPCIYCILPSVISIKHWCHFAYMILMHLL